MIADLLLQLKNYISLVVWKGAGGLGFLSFPLLLFANLTDVGCRREGEKKVKFSQFFLKENNFFLM